MQDQLKAAADERDSAIQAALKESVLFGEEQMRHRNTQAKLDDALARIKDSQEQRHVGFACWADNDLERTLTATLVNYEPLAYENRCAVYTSPVISREPELLAEIERLKALSLRYEFDSDDMQNQFEAGKHTSERQVEELAHKLAGQQAVIAQKNNALEAGMIVCDAVPNQAHKVSDVRPLQQLGILVNQDEGCHGIYATVRDALELTVDSEELNKLLAEAKTQAVPEGWKLVPIKPTEQWAQDVADIEHQGIEYAYDVISIVLSTAPKRGDE